MADFSGIDAKEESINKATSVRNGVKIVHRQAKSVKGLMDTYIAGTDPVFNTAINGIYTAAQRAELDVVRGKLATLIADLETNHASLIGINGS